MRAKSLTEVSQNFPNPFNNQTKIVFSLPQNGDVKIELFDILGKLIKSVELKNLPAGKNYFNLTGDNLSLGVYQISVNFLKQRFVKKLMLVK